MEIEPPRYENNKGQAVGVHGLDYLTRHHTIDQPHEASLEHHVHKHQDKQM
jgi:hypothetical protein